MAHVGLVFSFDAHIFQNPAAAVDWVTGKRREIEHPAATILFLGRLLQR